MGDFQIFTTLRYDPLLLTAPEQGLQGLGWNDSPSPFYMLNFHQERMVRAARHFGWDKALDCLSGETGLQRLGSSLTDLVRDLEADRPHRVRVTVSEAGELRCTAASVGATSLNNLFPSRLPSPDADSAQTQRDEPENAAVRLPPRNSAFEVVIDSARTPKSEFTHYKTTRRHMYDGARTRAAIDPPSIPKEVLLVVEDEDGVEYVMEGSISTPYFWRRGRWVTPPVSKTYSPTEGSGGQDGTSRRWALERNLVVQEAIPLSSVVDGEECWLSTGARGFFFGRINLQHTS